MTTVRYAKPIKVEQAEHFTVYRHENEFCSWPFNMGMWKIDNSEILVGFMNIPCDYTNNRSLNHDRVESFGSIATSRTTDGGATWERSTTIAHNIELADKLVYGKKAEYTQPHDFTNPQTLLSTWSTPNSADALAKPWFKLSADGGSTWGEAVLLPPCGIPRFQARPSYLVRPDGVILLFLTAKPAGNMHDRPVVYGSFDGGCNWSLVSIMPGSSEYRMICPSPVLMPDGRIIVGIRCKPSLEGAWNEVYESLDGGHTWTYVSRINDHGDVVSLVRLQDGRLVAVYGYRRPSFGIRARISDDEGRTWGAEMILRDDGGSMDLGYPRAIELEPGKIMTTYYFNDKSDPIQLNGGVRYIAGTIFNVD